MFPTNDKHVARTKAGSARRLTLLRDLRPVHAGTRRGAVDWEWAPENWEGFLAELDAIRAVVDSTPDRLWLYRGQADRRYLLDSTFVRFAKTDLHSMQVWERFSDRGGLDVRQRNELMESLFWKASLYKPSQELFDHEKNHGIDPWFEFFRRLQQYPEQPHPEVGFGKNYPKGTFIVDWTRRWDVALHFANGTGRTEDGALWIIDATATGKTLQRKTVREIIDLMVDRTVDDGSLGTPLIFYPKKQLAYLRVDRQDPVYVAQMEPVFDLAEVWDGIQGQPGNEQVMLKLVLPKGTHGDCRALLEERGITHEYLLPD